MNEINSIQIALDTARAELLDLGLRNSLINYRLLRTRGVEIVDESPPDVYRILVQERRAMSFLPRPEPEAEDDLQPFEDDEAEADPTRHTDNRLQTDYSPTELQRRLLNTYYTARTAIEEQGVTTLYLALGMLQWYESESSDMLHRAPLLLIPVEISRTSVRASFRIHYTEEDIGTNLSLQEKLKSDFSIELPDLPDADDLERSNIHSYYQKVNSAICHKIRWAVDESAIVLGFFSFAKFLMYHDLDMVNWPNDSLSQHPVLQSLLTIGFQEPESAIPDDAQIDEHLNPTEIHHVVDADSSQALAIHDVSQGRNLVIQGPPGTGKSQTITNLIAEAISKGKRVLFVAEKMAALEVVKRNLDKVGLGNACLELHSHKMNKKAVLDELKRILELSEPKSKVLEEEVRLLLNNRDVLNSYCQAVNTPIGESGITPYQAYGKLLTVKRRLSGVEPPPLDLHQFQHSVSEFREGLEQTEKLQAHLEGMGIPTNHPFWGSRCKVFLPIDREPLERTVAEARKTVTTLKDSSKQLAQYLKLPVPDTCVAVKVLIQAACHALNAPNLAGVDVQSTQWGRQSGHLDAGLRAGERLNQLYKKYENLLNKYNGNLIDEAWLKTVREIDQALELLNHSSTQLAKHLKLQSPDSLKAIESMIHAAHYLLDAPKMEGIELKATEWLTHIEDLETGLRAGEQLHQLHKMYDHVLIPEAWAQDVLGIRKALAIYGPKWWRFLSGKYRRARNELAGLCVQPLSKSLETQLRLVDAIRKTQREQLHLEEIQAIGQRLFGIHWRGESSNWGQLQTITEYLSKLHQLIERNEMPGELVDYLAANPDLETLRMQVSTIEEDRNRYRAAVRPFEQEIQLPESLDIQYRVVNMILDVKRIADSIINMQRNLEGTQELGKQFLGIHWQGDTSNWSQLQTIIQYVLVIHQSVDMDELPKKLVNYLASNPDFERLQGIISPLKAQRRIVDGIIEIKQTVDAIIEAQQEFENFQVLGKQLFGTRWQGESSNWFQLQEIVEYLSVLHESVKKGELPKALVHYVASNPDLGTLRTLVSTVETHKNNHPQLLRTVTKKIQLDETGRDGLSACSLTQQIQILECWEREAEKLQDIVTYNHLVDVLEQSGFAEIVKIANVWSEASQFLSDVLKWAWYSARVGDAMRERSILASFSSDVHQSIVDLFKKRDNLSLEYNKAKVAYKHWKYLPKQEFSGGQLGLLKKEFAKKRRHQPIRQLMDKAGNAIQTIKPIFMMSPLSVAKFLPPNSVDFDWVVFDEASQVKPVDAFGAIVRGKQTVVVGDDLQLPPTRFFDKHIADDGEDTEENLVGDMESILGLFSARNAPERMLRWHYRSLHTSLIAVSNHVFYNNKLIIFPNPYEAREDIGLIYHHNPDTVYDRGGSRTNPEEARIVAEKVMEHARSRPDLTLGVATFGGPQMTAIQDQLEILRRGDPSCETFFNAHPQEPFFVKNLENVQGDERDVIFISIGYGRDANGHLTMNFGPLNQKGGERRLNVLITRARQRCEVFSNLTADDIDLSRTTGHDGELSRGVEAFKRYLKYAETGELDIPILTDREADSPFEIEVADALHRLGYQVDRQIGSVGYSIDLGVKDSERPGRYLLGIECDGATYHSAQSARDRDRLRQQVLEGLGWRIHRIWSTDWFKRQNHELKKAAEEIEAAKVDVPPSPESPSENDPPNFDEDDRVPESEIDVPDPPRETPQYELAEPIISTNGLDLYAVSPFVMANWIQGIVKIESPVHLDEVARRIATAVGISRIGNRIRNKVKTAARQATRSGGVQIRGEFLYWTEQEDVTVRDRSELPNASRRLEFIAPEEIEVAIKRIVSDAFGIERADLAREVCRLFGFRSVSSDMRRGVDRVVERLIEDGQLIWQGNSLVIP